MARNPPPCPAEKRSLGENLVNDRWTWCSAKVRLLAERKGDSISLFEISPGIGWRADYMQPLLLHSIHEDTSKKSGNVNWKMIFCRSMHMKTLLRILKKVKITKSGVTAAVLYYTDYRLDCARVVPLVACSYKVVRTKIMNEQRKRQKQSKTRWEVII